MNTDSHRYETGMTNAELAALTEEIISCAFKVLNALGVGSPVTAPGRSR